MGTHPIFESDFDCLTENNECWFGSVAWRVSDFLFKKIMIRWKLNFDAICDLEAIYGVSLVSLVCLQYVFCLTYRILFGPEATTYYKQYSQKSVRRSSRISK